MDDLPPEILAKIFEDLTLQQYNLLRRSSKYIAAVVKDSVIILRANRTVVVKQKLPYLPRLKEFYGNVHVKLNRSTITSEVVNSLPSLTRATLTFSTKLKGVTNIMAAHFSGLYYKKIIDQGLSFQDVKLNFHDAKWRFRHGNQVRMEDHAYNTSFSDFLKIMVDNDYYMSFSFRGDLGNFFASSRKYTELYKNFERLKVHAAECNRNDWIYYLFERFLPHYSVCFDRYGSVKGPRDNRRQSYPNVKKFYTASSYYQDYQQQLPNAEITRVQSPRRKGLVVIMSNSDILIE